LSENIIEEMDMTGVDIKEFMKQNMKIIKKEK